MEAVTGRLLLESDLVRVAEFMERTIAADRLSYVADRLPALARLIWSDERCAHLERPGITSAMQLAASESFPAPQCAGDGSAVEAGNCRQK
jgi:hypothetical protein